MQAYFGERAHLDQSSAPNQYGGEFQDGGQFTIASSKTPALQAKRWDVRKQRADYLNED